ncbi:MAG: hypothetical protein EP297_02345 [Gammaproteobacteria bacterium]|nr:MAG: hypothetical protein EP297_02345 [Gammaproteobacteria bacterium]
MKINAYRFGHIEIEGSSYDSDVIITPDKVNHGWWRKQGHSLHRDDLDEVDEVVKAKPEKLIVGTGYYGQMKIPEETRQYLAQHNINLISAKTADAVDQFNRLQQECANIVAALHLTC